MVCIVSPQALMASAAFQRQTRCSDSQGPVSATLQKGHSPGCGTEGVMAKPTPSASAAEASADPDPREEESLLTLKGEALTPWCLQRLPKPVGSSFKVKLFHSEGIKISISATHTQKKGGGGW